MPHSIPTGFAPMPMGGDFIAANGPLYLKHETTPDGVELRLGFLVEQRHANPMGVCHGGMLATFADMLLPVLSIRQSESLRGRFLPTISLQVDYLAPVPLGAWVEGEATLLKVTRSIVFAQGLITADGVPVVRCSGVFKIGQTVSPAP